MGPLVWRITRELCLSGTQFSAPLNKPPQPILRKTWTPPLSCFCLSSPWQLFTTGNQRADITCLYLQVHQEDSLSEITFHPSSTSPFNYIIHELINLQCLPPVRRMDAAVWPCILSETRGSNDCGSRQVSGIRPRSTLLSPRDHYSQAACDIMEKEGASLVDRPRSIAAGDTLSGGMRVLLTPAGQRLKRLRK